MVVVRAKEENYQLATDVVARESWLFLMEQYSLLVLPAMEAGQKQIPPRVQPVVVIKLSLHTIRISLC